MAPEETAKKSVIAIDLGGTKIAGSLVNEVGELGERVQTPTPSQTGGATVAGAVSQLVKQLQETAADQGLRIKAVGIGSAGVVDREGRSIVASTDAIKNWPGTALARLVEESCGLPVIVENDVSAHLRGEAWKGAGQGKKDVLMMALGTGIGGAFMIDGAIAVGPHGVAGDFGHLPIDLPTNLTCTCGRTGPHLEAVASGPGLIRYFHERGGDKAIDSARELEKRAELGEELALEVYTEVGRVTGTALGGLANVIDPEIVIVGGGLARSGQIWWQPLREAFRAQLVDALAGLPLEAARLGNEAALVGAAKLAWDLSEEQSR